MFSATWGKLLMNLIIKSKTEWEKVNMSEII